MAISGGTMKRTGKTLEELNPTANTQPVVVTNPPLTSAPAG